MESELTFNGDMKKQTLTKNKLPSGIGSRLKAAREAMKLSQKDVAARMHLPLKFISIMENEEFNHDLPDTFIRGYLRAYGKLLNIDSDEINQAIEELGINYSEATPLASPSLARVQDFDINERYTNWGTYLIIIVLIAMVGMWWTSHSNDKNNPVPLKPAVSSIPEKPPLIQNETKAPENQTLHPNTVPTNNQNTAPTNSTTIPNNPPPAPTTAQPTQAPAHTEKPVSHKENSAAFDDEEADQTTVEEETDAPREKQRFKKEPEPGLEF